MADSKPIGLTKDSGFQVGVRRTLSVSHKQLWDFFFSDQGVSVWFGKLSQPLPLNKPFKSTDGFEGLVTTFREGSHFRMKWKKPGWSHFSMLQVRIMPHGSKAILAFHQDQLTSEQERADMKTHWEGVAHAIASTVGEPPA